MKDPLDGTILNGQTNNTPFPTRKGFFSSDRFSSETFLHPPLSCAPVYTWLWNAPITEAETEKQLQEMVRLGIKRFYILPLPRSFRPRNQPSMLTPNYLTEEYFRLYRHALLRAKELGMEVWLYNEGGWPSGGACGKVTASDPSLIRKVIKKRTFVLPKGRPYFPQNDVEATFCGARRIQNGEVFTKRTKLTEYYLAEIRNSKSADFPDLTMKESTDAFLLSTHEKYAEHIGDLFGNTVTALFTDEPTAPRPFPYRPALRDAFFDRYSVDITDFFPYLLGERPLTSTAKNAIIKWYTFLAEIFGKNYIDKEKEWCYDHDLTYLGHFDKDDEANALSGGNFDLLDNLRKLDVPGVDVICRQIFPPKVPLSDGANGFFPRLASSAAAQQGNRHALSESFAVYGNGLTFDEMRYVINFQSMRGINVYNFMLFSYGRNTFLRTGELPHFAASHACFRDLASFNGYCERLSYLFSLGKRDVTTALFFPLADNYLKNDDATASYLSAGKMLEASLLAFDVVSEDVLLRADPKKLSQGHIVVGASDYHNLVLPKLSVISSKMTFFLQRFIGGGGMVYLQDKDTDIAITDIHSIKELLHPHDLFVGDSHGFSVEKCTMENGELVFVMNESACKKDCHLRVGDRKFYLLDIAAVKIVSPVIIEDILTLSLPSGAIAALLFTQEDLPSEPSFTYYREIVPTKWSFRKTDAFAIGKNDFHIIIFHKIDKRVKLCDWRRYVGPSFSGSGEYRTAFSLPQLPERLRIDLGDVRYSCELFLNGISFGIRVMPPYVYDIPATLIKDKNDLTVRVTNSVANRFRYTTAFLKYPKYKLTQYAHKQYNYLKTSLAGGLFGPVKIFF